MTTWILSNRASLAPFLPELILGLGALLLLLLGGFRRQPRRFSISVGFCTLVVFLFSVIQLWIFNGSGGEASDAVLGPMGLFSDMVMMDGFALFFKAFAGFSTLVTLYFVATTDELSENRQAEMVAFLLAITLGLSLMASAQDLLMVYLGIEMVSVLSYVLVGYRANHRVSSEAGLKYVLYGGLATGIMVFGFSFLYGLVGSTNLVEIGQAIGQMDSNSTGTLVLFISIGIMAGLGYKVAAVPTHMWCPDVYQGAPLPVTAFLSVAPKAAGFALLVRFVVMFFQLPESGGSSLLHQLNWGLFLSILAALTMTIGNFAALRQNNLKRLMAYSSIAHAGYLLMGLCTFSAEGFSAMLFYLVTYFLMNFGAFLVIHIFSVQEHTEELDGYRGLAWRSPFLAWTLSIFLFSLVGLPPFAGFLGKLILFAAVIHEGLYWLAIVAVINTVISLFYYVRVIRTMFFEAPANSISPHVGWGGSLMILSMAIPTTLLVVNWEAILRLAEFSVAQLF